MARWCCLDCWKVWDCKDCETLCGCNNCKSSRAAVRKLPDDFFNVKAGTIGTRERPNSVPVPLHQKVTEYLASLKVTMVAEGKVVETPEQRNERIWRAIQDVAQG